jgi:hypothetical protein
LINREDRWASVLDNLKNGIDTGVEFKRNYIKKPPLRILGRSMSATEASVISGLSSTFFNKYKGQEVPVEDIVAQLENKWMREKNKMLQQGLR